MGSFRSVSRRVLIAWEFGSGLGHLACMYPIIRKLRERGCEPLVAVPDPDQAREIFGAEAPRLIPAVPLLMRRRPRGNPESFADLLLQRGFADTRTLTESVRRWQTLLHEEKIESVLLDYAHVAQLAAWLMDIPMVTRSTSFANPPAPIPCFRPSVLQSQRAARHAERQLLACVNAVARRFGRAPIDSIAQWLHAPYRFTTGLRETNVYDFEPEGGYLGPLGSLPNAESFDWPASGRMRVLCYLRWSRETPPLIAALKRADRDLACVVPGAPAEWLGSNDGSLVRATNRPVDLAALTKTADVVVSNGSAGVSCEALVAGKPQVFLPIDREKLMLAQRLEQLGVAVRAHGKVRATDTDAIDELLSSARDHAPRAADLSQRIDKQDWSVVLDRLCERVSELR